MTNGNEITCQEFVEMVTDYMEHVLLPEARTLFEKHADNCSGCDTYLKQMRQTIGLLQQIGDEQVSAGTRQKLLQAFGQLQQEKTDI